MILNLLYLKQKNGLMTYNLSHGLIDNFIIHLYHIFTLSQQIFPMLKRTGKTPKFGVVKSYDLQMNGKAYGV